jgi:phage terminase large subunit
MLVLKHLHSQITKTMLAASLFTQNPTYDWRTGECTGEASCAALFAANYNSSAQLIINQGGTDSGKTYAIMQVIGYIIASETPPQLDPVITVIGQSVPDVKRGSLRHWQAVLDSSDVLKKKLLKHNQTDNTYYFKNGWILEFGSRDSIQSAKQGKRQYLFVNECNGVPYQIFWQLAKRTRQKTFLDYNPSAPFWVHELLIGTNENSNDLGVNVELIISDHRHNCFLTKQEHDRTESIKDKNMFRVYARGLTGNLEGLIYPNWRMVPDDEFPAETDNAVFGVDFGFSMADSADPSAIVKCIKVGNRIYVKECAVGQALQPLEIQFALLSNGYDSNMHLAYCDHDLQMIADLRKLSINASKAYKKPNYKATAILAMQKWEICYTASSKNIHKERSSYMWAKDKVTGKVLGQPIDGDDHTLDAILYAINTHWNVRQNA